MKKLISVLICASVLAVSLTACSGETGASVTEPATAAETQGEIGTAPEPEPAAETTAEQTEAETEEAYSVPVKNDGTFEYIEYGDLSDALLSYVPVFSDSIVVAATISIYNTATGEFVRTVDLFAKEGEEGFGDINLGENETYLTYGFTCLSKSGADSVEANYEMVYEPGDIMQLQKEATVGLGYHYATIESEDIASGYNPADTEADIADRLSYLTANGYQTKITLQTEIVPQFN